MIEELTPEQEAKFPDYRKKWLDIGLATGPAQVEATIEAAKDAYKVADLAPPTRFIHADSPVQGGIAAGLLMHDEIRKEVMTAATKRGLIDFTGMDDIAAVDALIHSAIKFSEVSDRVTEKLTSEVHTSVGQSVYGSHDAAWLGFYDYMEFLGIDVSRLHPLMAVAKHCGWWIPFNDVCVIQNRPERIKLNTDGVIHCEDGPAIYYPEKWCKGFGVYGWNGTRVPDEWIEDKENLDPSIALTWENIEQRRCAAEIIGWDKVLEQVDSTIIDKNADPEIGILLDAKMPDPEIGTIRFLKYRCGTGRWFASPVDPAAQTAQQAQELNWGEDEYAPEVRT